ncbi:hypothetical protein QYF61_019693 [Mycteria americana]|uniref:Uncharacterized protein n=1 Tax=Mycteria americana TaxID=33587 RepID=A0AAN7PKF8_MYCAM|nr:hypothetical protein QYF61_019693 [Mycteria americana]
MMRQAVPLQPMEVHSGADIHLQHMEDPMPEQVDAQGGCSPVEDPTLEQAPGRTCGPMEREEPTLEQSCAYVAAMTVPGTWDDPDPDLLIDFLALAGTCLVTANLSGDWECWVTLVTIKAALGWVSKQFKKIIQRSAPRPDSYEWQGVWDSMGKYLGQWAPPVFWNFTPEQVQNPEKLVEYLEKVCCHLANSRETQITAMCWGLAHAYRALFNTIQNPQGSGNKMTGTAATAAPPATGTAAAAAPDNSVTSTAVQPGNQPVSVSVAPIHKKKSWKRKSAHLEREDEGVGPSQGEEEEELVNKTEATRSLSLSEL